MIDKQRVKAIAFDFGGTLDTPFLHWMDVYLHLYATRLGLSLSAEAFRPSYVHAERQMEALAPVQPRHTLLQTQLFKTRLQFDHLIGQGVLPDTPTNRLVLPVEAAFQAFDYARSCVCDALPVLQTLSARYPLYLVSNYYGNIQAVTSELGLYPYFRSVTDSTIEQVRKPDPGLWQCAIGRSGIPADQFLVVGDSFKNDIAPALSLGCQAVWGVPAGVPADAPSGCTVIRSLSELSQLL